MGASVFSMAWLDSSGEMQRSWASDSVLRRHRGSRLVLAGIMTLHLLFAWAGSASAASPYDGMSATDIAVAAAQDKSRQPPPRSAEKAVRGGSVTLSSFALVEMRGRFLHEGWYPIPGEPLPGPTAAQAVLLGPWQTAEFRLLDESNELLQQVTLARLDDDPTASHLTGSFDPPGQPFKVAVSGAPRTSPPVGFRSERITVSSPSETLSL